MKTLEVLKNVLQLTEEIQKCGPVSKMEALRSIERIATFPKDKTGAILAEIAGAAATIDEGSTLRKLIKIESEKGPFASRDPKG